MDLEHRARQRDVVRALVVPLAYAARAGQRDDQTRVRARFVAMVRLRETNRRLGLKEPQPDCLGHLRW